MKLFYKLKQFARTLYNSITGNNQQYVVVYDGLYANTDSKYITTRNNNQLLVIDKSYDMDANQDLYLVRTQNNTVHICEIERTTDTTPYNIKVYMRYYKYLKDQKADEASYFCIVD